MIINLEVVRSDIEAVLASARPVKERALTGVPWIRIAKRGGVVILTKVEIADTIRLAGEPEGLL